MALERIVLNIIPDGEMPVFHCSQYENGRPVIIDIVSSDDDAFLVGEGVSVELHCRKVDDNIVTLEPDEVDQNTVTFVSTEQLTACPGDNLCEIVLYSDTDPVQTIATLNFILHVEPDPLEGGLTSETQIYNLTQQIEEITQQVIGDDYYNKTEVDDLLDDKADKATTYTKSEVDTALNLKADKATTYTKTQVDSALTLKADASNVYTKSQVDTALASKADTTYVDSGLALKANAADVYTKAQTYSQAEVDALIDNIFPTLTASGAIASFTTALTKPLVSVTTAAGATIVTICGVNLANIPAFSAWDTSTNYLLSGSLLKRGMRLKMVFLDNDPSVDVSGCYFGFCDSNYSGGTVLDSQYRWTINSGSVQSNLQNTPANGDTSIYLDGLIIYPKNEVTYNKIFSRYKVMVVLDDVTPTTYSTYIGETVPVADATTLVTQSGVNNVYADVGDVTVQYKYMSM